MATDKNGAELKLADYEAKSGVGVKIEPRTFGGEKLWVCVDGVAVLRVNSPKIDLDIPDEINYEDEYDDLLEILDINRADFDSHDEIRKYAIKHLEDLFYDMKNISATREAVADRKQKRLSKMLEE